MLVRTIPIEQPIALTAEPLTSAAFAQFGDVIANPRPDVRPSNTPPEVIARGDLPCGAVSANQGTAIQYRAIATMRNLSASASTPATPRMTMFVSGARKLAPRDEVDGGVNAVRDSIEIKVLERHPFTTQTFIPLTADTTKRYVVVVAPTLPASTDDQDLPAPSPNSVETPGWKPPGSGLPDLAGLRAFIATGEQAVTYGAGTWHAPMIALGPDDTTIDFIVVQFSNDVQLEDCQEVSLEGRNVRDGKARIVVRVPELARKALAKL
ncbi:ureidoglycolate hydrolase [Xylariaceae sp. FL1272]|nr:ureidoglycolate hydrolase [Xylariaceae sp. FL1272]